MTEQTEKLTLMLNTTPFIRKMSDWSEADRPREKMLQQGAESLSDAELLAILLRSGTGRENVFLLSQRILSDCQGSLVRLSRLQLPDLLRYDGIGKTKALTLLAALELGKRRRVSEVAEGKVVGNSRDAYEYIQDRLSDLDHEEFWVIALDNKHRVMEKIRISIGGMTSTIVDSKLLFKQLLSRNTMAFILCHNHPSDYLQPSAEDMQLTKTLLKAADFLGIRMLDHLIVGSHSYFSFKDEGVI